MFSESIMTWTLISQCTGIGQQKTSQFNFLPGRRIRVFVYLNNGLCDAGYENTGVLLAAEIHGLVFQLGVFLVEFQNCSIKVKGCAFVIVLLHVSLWKTYLTWTLYEQKICLFIPIIGVDSEIFSVPDKNEWTFGVECTV